VKARRLTSEGTWERIARDEGEAAFNAQEALMEIAERQAAKQAGARRRAARDTRRRFAVRQAAGAGVGAGAGTGTAVEPGAGTGAESGARAGTDAAAAQPEHVRATVIEEAPGADGGRRAAMTGAGGGAGGVLTRRQPSRLIRGLALIGLGFKTIFGRGGGGRR